MCFFLVFVYITVIFVLYGRDFHCVELFHWRNLSSLRQKFMSPQYVLDLLDTKNYLYNFV